MYHIAVSLPTSETMLRARFLRPAALCFVLLLALALVSCAAPTPAGIPNQSSPPTPAATKSGVLHFVATSTPNASSMPTVVAQNMLKQAGYDVQVTIVASVDLATAALAQGTADIANIGPLAAWTAQSKGAKIRIIATNDQNPFSIVTGQQFKACQDLDKHRFANGAASNVNAILVGLYFQQQCPGITPEFVTVTDSQARTAALLAGQIDATTVEISDLQLIDAKAPGKFHSLVTFGKVFPRLMFGVAAVNLDFAATHPDIVQDYVRALVTANRTFRAKPSSLTDAMVQYLKYSPDQAKQATDAYLAAGIWDLNGGLTPDTIKATSDFYVANRLMSAPVKLEEAADLSYLNKVLDELGRQ